MNVVKSLQKQKLYYLNYELLHNFGKSWALY